ncbi:major facilitator superfamily domain-containing protein [Chaetomidium leptoderma]|uniref:Major facilitator superfamily domain-containing protein n=1 Tax=Chaetomidium leptoderma TaxID=669021 RepID=A0AAN6ZZN3_9PEZI|nr:major facilitator superfamily domain-containing protein [Chaetomidium leptoderma]
MATQTDPEHKPRSSTSMSPKDTAAVPPATNETLELTPFVPPDGGRDAWMTVAGGWLCQFCSFGFVNSLGSIQYIYEKEILTHESSLSDSGLTCLERGPYLSRPSFSVGGLIALSFATEYWQIFLAQSVCFGLGAAGTFISGLVAAGQYFKKRRALVMGIVASGSSCGGLVFPIMLARLFDQIGFRQTLRYTALMIGILLAIANLLVSSPVPPKGLAGRRSLMSFATFKKPTYLLFVTGSFLFFWGLFGPFDYLPLFTSEHPATQSIALYTVAILNGASIFGRILPNIYSDRVGSSVWIITACALLSAVSVLVIWLPVYYYPSAGGLVVFVVVFGFASGAFISLMTPALLEVAGGHTNDDLSVMIGTFFAIIAIASLTGLPVQGAAAGHGGNVMGLIVFCGVAMIAGTALVGCAALLSQKNKRKAAEKATDGEP